MAAADPEADRAARMGAVAFLRLRRSDLVRAAEGGPSDRAAGSVVLFPNVRDEPAAPVYEDPRWADLHRQD